LFTVGKITGFFGNILRRCEVETKNAGQDYIYSPAGAANNSILPAPSS
jgi:hypothetical protein